VAGLSVPPASARPWPAARHAARKWHHQFLLQYFQTPGIAEAEFERDVGLAMRTLLGRGFSDPASLFVEDGKGFLGNPSADRPLPPWLGEADLAYFTEAYRKSGFRGGLNWYRNIDRNWELTAPWQGAQIHQPSLFMAGSKDSVITGLIGAKRVADMERVLPNLKQKLIVDGASHWIQQERAAEVNAGSDCFSQGERTVGNRCGSVEPAAAQQFARTARIDGRVGRNRPEARHVTVIGLIRDCAWILDHTAAGARAPGGGHFRWSLISRPGLPTYCRGYRAVPRASELPPGSDGRTTEFPERTDGPTRPGPWRAMAPASRYARSLPADGRRNLPAAPGRRTRPARARCHCP